MGRTLADLADDLEKLAAQLPQEATSNLSAQVAETVFSYLLSETPVDTGKAISNWRVSLNAPNHDLLPAYYPGQKGSTQSINQQAALEEAQRVLSTKKPGDAIYISNPLPYIQSLNDGSSTQNPGGFVEASVLLARLVTENPASFTPQGFA